jgi:hypothetical protein
MKIFQFPGRKKAKVAPKTEPSIRPAQVQFSDDDDEVFEPGPGLVLGVPASASASSAKAVAVEEAQEGRVKIKGTWFVSSMGALSSLLDSEKKPRVVLRGDLVLMSLNSAADPGERYVKQLPRVATPSIGSLLKADVENAIVNVWLLKDAVDRLAANRVSSVSLEIDQFFQFPGAKKGKKILLTSWKQNRMWPVSALVFKDGIVENLIEKKCNARDFEQDMRQLVDQLRNTYPEYELIWADPADSYPGFLPAGTQNAGSKPYVKLVNKPILGHGQKITRIQQYGLSLAIVVLSIIGYAGGLALPYQDYANIRADLQKVLGTFKSEKEFSTDQLGVLQARRFFISEPRAQAQQTEMLRKAIVAVGKLPQRAWIQDMKLVAAEPGKKGELTITLRVVKDVETDGVTQLRGIPLALSNELGFPIRTVGQNGIQDVIEAKRAVRQIKLEGVF